MADLFAQASANWDAANQWNTAANGSGSYQTPGPSDRCMMNAKNVTINVSVTVQEITNNAYGGTVGGTATISPGVVVTANYRATEANAKLLRFTANAPNTCNIIGNGIAGYNGSNNLGCENAGTGTMYITGNMENANFTYTTCTTNASTGTMNVTGTVSSIVTNNGTACLINSVGGVLNLTGSTAISVSTSVNAVSNNGAGILNIFGTPSSSGIASAAINASSGQINLTCSVLTGQSTSAGACLMGTGAGVINITGEVRGGTTAPAVYGTTAAGQINISGLAWPGAGPSGWAAVRMDSVNYPAIVAGPGWDATHYNSPYVGRVVIRTPHPSPLDWRVRDEGGVTTTLYTNTTLMADSPANADVRYGTTYQGGGQTGSLRVPPTGSVFLGVPTDATTGTATLSASDIRAAIGLYSANLDTQLAKLGTPVALDGGTASLAGMLAKMADDAGGAEYDAGTDSLREKVAGGGATPQEVWEYATRTITAGGLTQADVRTALGMASANLDTQLGGLPTGAELEARTLPAADYLVVGDTPSAADIKTALEADGGKLDHLWEMTEDDGGVRRLTAAALAETPGAGADPWLTDTSDPDDYPDGTAGYELHDLYSRVTEVLPDYPSAVVPGPPTAEQTSAWIRCLDVHGAPEVGVAIQVRLVRVEEGTDAYDMAPITAMSAAAGLQNISAGVAVAVIPRGSGFVFEARRGTTSGSRWVRFRGADVPILAMPQLLGLP